LLGVEQLTWLARLGASWPDLNAAYRWLLRPGGSVADARALVTGLRWCFWIRGNYGEALQWFHGWRELAASASAAERASLCNGVAIALFYSRRFEEAAEVAVEAAAAASNAGAAWERAFAHALLEWVAAMKPTGAAKRRRKQGPRPEADPWLRAFARMGPAFGHLFAGRSKQALAEIETILELLEGGDRHLTMFAAAQQALLHCLAGRIPAARRAALRQAELAWQLSNPRALAAAAEIAAYLSIAEGAAALGARLLGAAEHGREATGSPHHPQWEAPHRDAVARAVRALGRDEFEANRAVGRKMGPREAASIALEAHAAGEARPRRAQRS
jgi:hypothetical protein